MPKRAPRIAHIKCDRFNHALPEGKHAGNSLRTLLGTPESKNLWQEQDGDDVLVSETEASVLVKDGARFFTTPKKINNS